MDSSQKPRRHFSKLEEHYLVPVVLMFVIAVGTAMLYCIYQHHISQMGSANAYWLGITEALQGKISSIEAYGNTYLTWSIFMGLAFTTLIASLIYKKRWLYMTAVVASLTLFFFWAF